VVPCGKGIEELKNSPYGQAIRAILIKMIFDLIDRWAGRCYNTI
jgi:hypothetical protein